jgi:putative flippase GtrA
VLAERSGLRIHEVPVDWVDDPDSRVDIARTARADLAGVARMLRALTTGRLPVAELRSQIGRQPLTAALDGVPAGLVGQLARFAVIGVLSTLAYVLLFLVLRGPMTAQGANLSALLVTAVANTAGNRRLTFGIRGGRGAARSQVQGLIVFGIGLGLTSGTLAVLQAVLPGAPSVAELLLLVLANALATLVRFVLFRGWVFRSRPRASARPAAFPDGAPAVPTMESAR